MLLEPPATPPEEPLVADTKYEKWLSCATQLPPDFVAPATGVQAPGRLPQRHPDGLGIDVGVGRPQHRPLERRQRSSELVALVQIGRRPGEGLLCDTESDRCSGSRACAIAFSLDGFAYEWSRQTAKASAPLRCATSSG